MWFQMTVEAGIERAFHIKHTSPCLTSQEEVIPNDDDNPRLGPQTGKMTSFGQKKR